ncbi:MAG: hypothetical protein ACOVRM_12140, partial [Planctomycetaceae bacterium]
MFRTCLLTLLVAMLPGIPSVMAQTALIRPNENLVAEGIPEIPAVLAEKVQRYTESRSASFAAWHPQRREMLISTRFGNTPQIHEVRLPGGARRQLTFYAEPVGGASWEPREGRFFVFSRD